MLAQADVMQRPRGHARTCKRVDPRLMRTVTRLLGDAPSAVVREGVARRARLDWTGKRGRTAISDMRAKEARAARKAETRTLALSSDARDILGPVELRAVLGLDRAWAAAARVEVRLGIHALQTHARMGKNERQV